MLRHGSALFSVSFWPRVQRDDSALSSGWFVSGAVWDARKAKARDAYLCVIVWSAQLEIPNRVATSPSFFYGREIERNLPDASRRVVGHGAEPTAFKDETCRPARDRKEGSRR